MKYTTKQKIALVLEDRRGEWIPAYELIKVHTKYGWLGSSADREARYVAEDGKIEVDKRTILVERKRDGKYAYYRSTGSAPITREVYRPMSYNPETNTMTLTKVIETM